MGRFINADGFVSTGQGFVGNNMFAYCLNTPVNGCDPCGTCHHNWSWKNCERCQAAWDNVGTFFTNAWNCAVDWCEETYSTISSIHQQQAQLQTQITMQQNEMIADAAKKTWNAYQKGYALQQESTMRLAKSNIDMFDSPEDIERSVDIIEATVSFSVATYQVARIATVANPTTGAVIAAIAGLAWAARAIYRACQ